MAAISYPTIDWEPSIGTSFDYYYDYDLIQCKSDACKPAQYTQYIVISLQTDYMVNYKTYSYLLLQK